MSTEPAIRPALRLVDPETGELHSVCPDCAEKENTIAGLNVTIHSQAGIIGRQTRQLEDADPSTHPQHAEMAALIDRWKQATSHPKARRSKDRFEVIKARLKEGYTFAEMELAIDGIGAFPFMVEGKRVQTGKPSQRHDRLGLALESGEKLERFANLGAIARRA